MVDSCFCTVGVQVRVLDPYLRSRNKLLYRVHCTLWDKSQKCHTCTCTCTVQVRYCVYSTVNRTNRKYVPVYVHGVLIETNDRLRDARKYQRLNPNTLPYKAVSTSHPYLFVQSKNPTASALVEGFVFIFKFFCF